MIHSDEIHARLRGQWPSVLSRLGIGQEFLKNRHGPCPACGGRDRYRFDDKYKHGNFYCNSCGSGDGFKLLMLVNGWDFPRAIEEVVKATGLKDYSRPRKEPGPIYSQETPEIPTARVREILRTSCKPDAVPEVMVYLDSRGLLPLPKGCRLRAHAMAEYWDGAKMVGHFSALVAPVHDILGRLVTCHVTYLAFGKKLADRTPRKILSGLGDRQGCAVHLMEPGHEMGIGEGIESCLAWSKLHKLPAWSCLNTSILTRFEPPNDVDVLHIIADNDVAGMKAAWRLRDRLGIDMKLSLPKGDDWNTDLMERGND